MTRTLGRAVAALRLCQCHLIQKDGHRHVALLLIMRILAPACQEKFFLVNCKAVARARGVAVEVSGKMAKRFSQFLLLFGVAATRQHWRQDARSQSIATLRTARRCLTHASDCERLSARQMVGIRALSQNQRVLELSSRRRLQPLQKRRPKKRQRLTLLLRARYKNNNSAFRRLAVVWQIWRINSPKLAWLCQRLNTSSRGRLSIHQHLGVPKHGERNSFESQSH